MMKPTMLLAFILLFSPALSLAITGNTDLVLTGRIISKTCDVASDSVDQTVNLGEQDNRQFTNTGTKSDPVTFSIHFNHCGSKASTVGVGFYGTVVEGKHNILALDPGSTVNVGIELSDAQGNALPINPANGYTEYGITPSADNSVSFKAHYIALGYPVTAGEANGTATFNVIWP